jgi:hypothetical protein
MSQLTPHGADGDWAPPNQRREPAKVRVCEGVLPNPAAPADALVRRTAAGYAATGGLLNHEQTIVLG